MSFTIPSLEDFSDLFKEKPRAAADGWPFSPKLKEFGVVYAPALVAPHQEHWRIKFATGPYEWDGRHSIFVDVQDERGERVIGAPVTCWNGGENTKPTESKPGESFAVDFPMFAARNAYGVRMADGLPSDSLFGMGLLPFEGHVVFMVIFQLQRGVIKPDPPEPPTEPPLEVDITALRAQFARVVAELDALGRLL